MPDFKFLNATQNDKGTPHRRRGWVQAINAHSATMGHARRRRSLDTRTSSDVKLSSKHLAEISDERIEGEINAYTALGIVVTRPTASNNERFQVSRELTAHIHLPKEITSPLDPFLRLPADCSALEKSLLRFHLQHGRRNMLGTCANPKYDIALDAGRRHIESNPVWAWVHIVVAEEILAQLTYRPKTPNFYRRRACAYADTKRLLLDDHVSLPAKLATLLMLQVMESYTGNWHLQAMHSDAIDQLVAANGGLTLFLRKNKGENDMVQPIWFLSIWRAGLFKLLPRAEFEEASSSLCGFFHEIRQWMASTRDSKTDQGQRQCNMVALAQLSKYLSDLISTNFCLEAEDAASSMTFQSLATFALTLHLCGTFTRLQCDLAMTAKFLLQFQEYVKDSFSDPDGSFPEASKLGIMHLNGVTSMLSHVRRHVHIPGVPQFSMEQEVQLCIVSMHAVKVFPMLCLSTRRRLARCMLNCALACTQDVLAEDFSEHEIEDVRTELEMSWHQAVSNEPSGIRQQRLDMLLTPPDSSGRSSEPNDGTWNGS